MPRYFMHLRDGTSELIDPEGKEFADLGSMRKGNLSQKKEWDLGQDCSEAQERTSRERPYIRRPERKCRRPEHAIGSL